jgi:hypothetical protein
VDPPELAAVGSTGELLFARDAALASGRLPNSRSEPSRIEPSDAARLSTLLGRIEAADEKRLALALRRFNSAYARRDAEDAVIDL